MAFVANLSVGEKILVGEVDIMVVKRSGEQIKLSIEAPPHIKIKLVKPMRAK